MHVRRTSVLVNALVLQQRANAARVFLENVLRELPFVWEKSETRILLPADANLPSDVTADVVRIPLPVSGARRALYELTILPSIIARVRPDILVVPNESFPTRVRVPIVVVAQNLLYHCPDVGPFPTGSIKERARSRLQFAYYRRQMPRAYRRADVIVAVSDHAARTLAGRAGLDLSRVRIVPCGADHLPLLPRTRPSGRRRLLIVGAIAQYKRLDVAVHALAELRRTGGDYELFLVGEEWPGYGQLIDDVARANGVKDDVTRLGPVSDAVVAELLASSYAALSLSSCESFGIPVVEALRAGLPTVVADEPWSREFVRDVAIRVDGADSSSVAAGVRALEETDERNKRVLQGRALAARYTWRRTAQGIAEAGREAISSYVAR